MKRVLALLAAIAAIMFTGVVSAQSSESEEDALAQRVTEARAAVAQAEQALSDAHTQYDPVLQRHEDLSRQREANSVEIRRLLDAVDRAMRNQSRLPVALTARRDALLDVIARLYRENQNGRNDARIREREAQLADVEAQIAALEAEIGPQRALVDRLSRERDAAFAERDRLDGLLIAMMADVSEARVSVRSAEERLAEARDALNDALAESRWRLNDNAPPILTRVEAGGRNREPAYVAEWIDPAEELEDLLRLAEYLHEDLGRTQRRRRQSIDEWIEIIQADQARANEMMEAYRSAIGGSSDSPFWGWMERQLDNVSGGWAGALVTGGSLTWSKIGVQLTDSAVNVLRDMSGLEGQPPMLPWQAVAVEAVVQLYGAYSREGDANPSWRLENMVTPNELIRREQNGMTANQERALLESITAAQIRAGLERMRGPVADGLETESFRDALLSAHGEMALAAAFSESVFRGHDPDMDISNRPLLGSPVHEWAFATVFSSTNGVKSAGSILGGIDSWFGNFRGEAGLYARGQYLNVIQAFFREAALEQIERQRILTWNNYLMAALDVEISLAQLRNEGRARRIEARIQRLLAEELIPQLRREIEAARLVRELRVESDRAVVGRRAELRLTFSAPARIESATLGGRDLDLSGGLTEWTASFRPGDFEADRAPLIVVGGHAAFEDRALDEPSTVARWSNDADAFEAYEPGPDENHSILVEPPEGAAYAIVLDTSGSMEDNNRIVQARVALSEFFASNRIRSGDEVGVFTFSGCGVAQTVDFTEDVEAAAGMVQSVGVGGYTPLAAAITVAADALAARNVERGALIIVTDGEESCDGAVGAALAHARARLDEVNQRTVR